MRKEKTLYIYWKLGVKQIPIKLNINFRLPTWVLLLEKNNEMNIQLQEILDVNFKMGGFFFVCVC